MADDAMFKLQFSEFEDFKGKVEVSNFFIAVQLICPDTYSQLAKA